MQQTKELGLTSPVILIIIAALHGSIFNSILSLTKLRLRKVLTSHNATDKKMLPANFSYHFSLASFVNHNILYRDVLCQSMISWNQTIELISSSFCLVEPKCMLFSSSFQVDGWGVLPQFRVSRCPTSFGFFQLQLRLQQVWALSKPAFTDKIITQLCLISVR